MWLTGYNFYNLNSNFENRYDEKTPKQLSDLDSILLSDDNSSSFAVNFYINSASNKPSSGSGCVLTWASSSKYGAQFVLTDSGMFYRKNSNGTISDWKTITLT